jgi:hypothetical protein
MTRAASLFLAGILLSNSALADPEAPASCFNGMDLFNVARSHFWPATMFDYSLHGDATDSEITRLIESGVGYGQLFVDSMTRGRTEVSNVALAAPADRLRPILRTISTKLLGEHLPYLNFLLVGPPEFRDEAKTLIEGMGATFIFVPNQVNRCEKLPASSQSGSNSGPSQPAPVIY